MFFTHEGASTVNLQYNIFLNPRLFTKIQGETFVKKQRNWSQHNMFVRHQVHFQIALLCIAVLSLLNFILFAKSWNAKPQVLHARNASCACFDEEHVASNVTPGSVVQLKTREQPNPNLLQPLPNLTLTAQDSFYGLGCKENRYRKRLQKILHEWEALAKRRNITQYFLCFGSLLGLVRNGDMVPYDSDMDVCMFRRDYYKLDAEESKRPLNLNDGQIHFLLQRHSPHPKRDTPRQDCKGNLVRRVSDHCAILDPHGRLFHGALIYMDIFMLEDHGAVFWDEYRDRMHNQSAILPVKSCKFLGVETKCPNDVEKYLNVYYGKDYMTPHRVCAGGKWVKNLTGTRKPFV